MLKANDITWIKDNKTILKKVSCEIKKGECIGLTGPNGAGKSSLLKILSFLEKPTEGKIIFENEEIPAKIPLVTRRKIAVVFQEPLLLNINVFQNVAAGLKMRKMHRDAIRSTVQTWLEAFGVAHLSAQHAHSLSGGEAQRVSLARAFALKPEILFLDEPFAFLDAPTVEDLLMDLKKVFASTGITTLIISHNIRDLSRLADKLCVMMEGEIKAFGAVDEVLAHPGDARTELFLKQLALH